MSHTRTLAVIALLAAFFALPCFVPAQDKAEVELRAAMELETVKGDLKGAIASYAKLAKGSNRPVAARALVQMGQCYEKLGQADARAVYERVIREFADQAEQVQVARTKLAALTMEGHKPTFTRIRVPTKLPNSQGTMPLSPDGRQLAYFSGGSLWLLPVHGPSDPGIAGAPRRLTEPVPAWEACQDIAWSRDGNWLALNIVERLPDGKYKRSFYMIRSATGESRRIPINLPMVVASTFHDPCLSLSPDGEWLAYTNWLEVSGPRSVYLVPTSGGTPRQLTQQLAAEPSFSADGNRIVYLGLGPVSPDDRSGVMKGREIWVAPVSGGTPALLYRLDGPGRLRGPTWSADGKSVAFFLNRIMGTDLCDQMILLPASYEGRPLTSPAAIKLPQQTVYKPSGWSPDNQIGLVANTPELNAVYSVPATGGKAIQLTPKTALMPTWMPDGKRIYFPGAHDGLRTGIEFVPAEGGAVARIPFRNADFQPLYPSVSPDGKQILFMAIKEASARVWGMFTVPVEGGDVTEIPVGIKWAFFPCWAADGKSFAFVGQEDLQGPADIYAISTSGGKAQKLTSESDGVSRSPVAWSPDGSTIAFRSKDNKIRLLSVKGGPTHAIKEGLTDGGSDPAWSPDGKELGYITKGKIFKVSLEDGKRQEVLTGLDANHSRFAWSPDGKTIAFGATQGGSELELWLVSDFLPLLAPKR